MKKRNKILLLILLIGIGCSTDEETKPITIYMIGDSTMANKPEPDKNPERGWGQMLHLFFNEHVNIKNRAVNGRSTRSYIDEGKWKNVYDSIQAGDYVFIQFGHNDSKFKDSARYTNPHTAYRHNLKRFVKETREKGGIPVLFSSIVRRNFNEYGVLIDTHGEYPLEVRLVAEELNVPFIDLQYQTEVLEASYGPENSKKLHLHYQPGEIAYYQNGKDDDTHLSVLGATNVAKLAAIELRKKVPDLRKYIVVSIQ